MASTSESIHSIARTQEERILLTQIAQKAETCRDKCYLTYTKFLDMHEAALADRLLRSLGEHGIFWGGYEQAERRILFLCRTGWMLCQQRERIVPSQPFAVCGAKMMR